MDRIWNFLAERSVEQADGIEAAIREGTRRLLGFPHLGKPRRDGSRELLLAHIQYRIAYAVQQDRILIAAVWSTRENHDR